MGVKEAEWVKKDVRRGIMNILGLEEYRNRRDIMKRRQTGQRRSINKEVCVCAQSCQDPLSTGFPRQEYWGGLPFPTVEDLPTQGWEDAPEKGKAPHSGILAWRIPWTVQSVGLQRDGHS